MATEAKEKVILVSADGEHFEVDKIVAMESRLLYFMIEDECAETGIPISNIDGNILARVIEYCKKHIEYSSATGESAERELKAWDSEFVKVDTDTLYDLITASNYLDIKGLLDLTCQAAVDMMKGKSPDQIRKTFNIKNDFSPAEEEEIKKEHGWAFE